MDESRVNARGMDPIKPWFAKIDAARDMAALQPVMADLHDILVHGSILRSAASPIRTSHRWCWPTSEPAA